MSNQEEHRQHESGDWIGWVFEGDSVTKLRELLIDAGPTPRLEVHLQSGMQAYFKIIPSPGFPLHDYTGVNDSHIHPPWP